jgi:hypothetical protein
VILQVTRNWYCPNCVAVDQTSEAQPHTRFHTCPGLRNLTAPMIEVGVKAKVEAREREDYVGKELVQTDGNGRPVMSVVTTREDGQDCMVMAPVAVSEGKVPPRGLV